MSERMRSKREMKDCDKPDEHEEAENILMDSRPVESSSRSVQDASRNVMDPGSRVALLYACRRPSCPKRLSGSLSVSLEHPVQTAADSSDRRNASNSNVSAAQ